MAAVRRTFGRIITQRLNYSAGQNLRRRLISTSNKNKDTTTLEEAIAKKPKPIDISEAKNHDWISYGFSYESEAKDRAISRLIMFMSITVGLIGSAFIIAYMPDLRARDWTRREAYLELHRREKLGLPRVDPDLIDRSKIVLPSDEELGDTEIII